MASDKGAGIIGGLLLVLQVKGREAADFETRKSKDMVESNLT